MLSRSMSTGLLASTFLLIAGAPAHASNLCPSLSAADPASCALVFLHSNGFADSPFSITVVAGGDTATFSGNSVSDTINKFNAEFTSPGASANQLITAQFFSDIFGAPGVSNLDISPALFAAHPLLNTVPISVSANFEHLDATLDFPANSSTLSFSVVGTNIHDVAAGATRYDSIVLFNNWLKNNSSILLNELHDAMARYSTSDPIVGNPQGVLGSIGQDTVFFQSSDGESTSLGASPHLDPAFTMSIEPEYFEANGTSGVALRVPISYTWYLDDPRYAITLDAPIVYLNEGSTNSLQGAFGVGIRIPLSDHWYVTPQFHAAIVGTVGSDQLNDYGAALYALGVRSKYNFYLDDGLTLSIINAGEYYHSIGVQIGKYNLDPNLESGLLSNGVQVEKPSAMTLFGNPTTWDAYAIDNRIVGTHGAVSGWEELGLNFGTRTNMTGQAWDNLRFGTTFAFGAAGYRSFELNLTVRF